MKHVKRLIALLLLVPIIVIVVAVIIDNPEPISIHFLGFLLGELSAGAWMMLSFVVGGVAGLLAGSAIIFQLRARIILLSKSSGKQK
ncbi:MAG: LapA family protein [Pseudomonadales bacterium]|nr:LapA family protein [Pseudomonadales bacterium]